MAERKPFLLRIDPGVLEALQRWAADDLRSLNSQIEFVLRRALQREGCGGTCDEHVETETLDTERVLYLDRDRRIRAFRIRA